MMEQLTPSERQEWVEEAKEALLGRKLLRAYSLASSYSEVAGERAWRNSPAAEILLEAYEALQR